MHQVSVAGPYRFRFLSLSAKRGRLVVTHPWASLEGVLTRDAPTTC
jgi:hypothetical protein